MAHANRLAGGFRGWAEGVLGALEGSLCVDHHFAAACYVRARFQKFRSPVKMRRIAMKKILRSLALASLAVSLSNTAQAQQAITADQLVGAWELKSMVIHDASTTERTEWVPSQSGI